MSDHSDWSPSSGSIWLNCPGSVAVNPLYKEQEDKEDITDASNIGTIAHGVLENCLLYDVPAEHEDYEIVEGVELAVEFVHSKILSVPQTTLYVERRLYVPDTPIWGTTDVLGVSPQMIHVADYKHGWVPVDVVKNVQLMLYLLAAIAEFGPRPEYWITVMQPRYLHRDGPTRSYRVTEADLAQLKQAIGWALSNRDKFFAGKHCKYCKVRGACATLAGWLLPRINEFIAYDITNKHTFSNETMAKLLDFVDMVPGWVSAVKQEAFKRALNDRRIGGHKIVKGKAERKVQNEEGLKAKYVEWGIPVDALYEASLVTPLTVEKQLKARFKAEGRGKWQEYMQELVNEGIIGMTFGSLTLVRDVDGRPQFNKGDEFGELPLDSGDIQL